MCVLLTDIMVNVKQYSSLHACHHTELPATRQRQHLLPLPQYSLCIIQYILSLRCNPLTAFFFSRLFTSPEVVLSDTSASIAYSHFCTCMLKRIPHYNVTQRVVFICGHTARIYWLEIISNTKFQWNWQDSKPLKF